MTYRSKAVQSCDPLKGVNSLGKNQEIYPKRDDPEDPLIPLAWVFKRGTAIIGPRPPSFERDCRTYKKLVIGNETWFVHCSNAGAIDILFKALGEGNIEIEAEDVWILTVPEDMVGSWIGKDACVAGFLKHMIGLRYIRVKGDKRWQRR